MFTSDSDSQVNSYNCIVRNTGGRVEGSKEKGVFRNRRASFK